MSVWCANLLFTPNAHKEVSNCLPPIILTRAAYTGKQPISSKSPCAQGLWLKGNRIQGCQRKNRAYPIHYPICQNSPTFCASQQYQKTPLQTGKIHPKYDSFKTLRNNWQDIQGPKVAWDGWHWRFFNGAVANEILYKLHPLQVARIVLAWIIFIDLHFASKTLRRRRSFNWIFQSKLVHRWNRVHDKR
jgi:hypothetical protein